MNWLGRQSLSRIAAIGAAWVILLPSVVAAIVWIQAEWFVWREARRGGVSGYSIGVDFSSPGAVFAGIILLAPVTALFVAWLVARRR